ncbi:MAG: hypothetical protein J7M18_06195, partial [Candidatus Eremiobacteraeota bacterium]|nr:hypothetical protein [Candidatus Eremiobacteraeota bacterium]
ILLGEHAKTGMQYQAKADYKNAIKELSAEIKKPASEYSQILSLVFLANVKIQQEMYQNKDKPGWTPDLKKSTVGISELEKARKRLEKYDGPNKPELLYELGMSFLQRGLHSRAIQPLKESYENDKGPTALRTKIYYLICLIQTGQGEKLSKELDKVFSEIRRMEKRKTLPDKNLSELYHLHACARHQFTQNIKGDNRPPVQEVIDAFKEVIRIYPTGTQAMESMAFLGQIYLELGDKDKSLYYCEELAKAIEKNLENRQSMDEQGCVMVFAMLINLVDREHDNRVKLMKDDAIESVHLFNENLEIARKSLKSRDYETALKAIRTLIKKSKSEKK